MPAHKQEPKECPLCGIVRKDMIKHFDFAHNGITLPEGFIPKKRKETLVEVA